MTDKVVRPTPLEVAATRRLLGLTVEELSRLLDVNPRTIRGWEVGRSTPGEGVWAAVQRLREGHDQEAQKGVALVDQTGGVTLSLDRDFPGGSVPRGWMVALAARVLVERPGALVEWAE